MADLKKKKAAKAEKPEKIEKDIPVVDDEESSVQEVEIIDQAAEEKERLENELAREKDMYLRLAAEFDNYKKRTARETQRIGSDSRAAVIKELLPTVDNFARTLENADADHENFKKGVELSIKNFLTALEKLGVEEIEATGIEFDPNFHFAVSQIEDEALGENIVSQVMQKGYKIGDNVIRPAMVTVANCK